MIRLIVKISILYCEIIGNWGKKLIKTLSRLPAPINTKKAGSAQQISVPMLAIAVSSEKSLTFRRLSIGSFLTRFIHQSDMFNWMIT